MRNYRAATWLALVLAAFAWAQQPNVQKAEPAKPSTDTPAKQELTKVLEPKIKAEWEALRTRDKKAYGDLLADDFVGIENDGQGARGKTKAVNELPGEAIKKYTLFGFGVIPLAPDAAFVTYESTMEFPPKSLVKFSRVYIGELWLRRNGEWKLRHSQETHVR